MWFSKDKNTDYVQKFNKKGRSSKNKTKKSMEWELEDGIYTQEFKKGGEKTEEWCQKLKKKDEVPKKKGRIKRKNFLTHVLGFFWGGTIGEIISEGNGGK